MPQTPDWNSLQPIGPSDYEQIARQAAQQYGVDPDFVSRIGKQESGWNPQAIGPVTRNGQRAVGLMQLMPGTAKQLGVDPSDPIQNIQGGVRELARLHQKYHGDQSLMAAAYNAGEGKVDKYGGVPPYRETRNYVAQVAAKQQQAKGPDWDSLQPVKQAPQATAPNWDAMQPVTVPTPQAQQAPAFQPVSPTFPGGGYTDITGQPQAARQVPHPDTIAQQAQLYNTFQKAHDAGDTRIMRSAGIALKKLGWEYGETTPGWPYVKPSAAYANLINQQMAMAQQAAAPIQTWQQNVAQPVQQMLNRPQPPPAPTGIQAMAATNPILKGAMALGGGAIEGTGKFIAGLPKAATLATPLRATQGEQAATRTEQGPVLGPIGRTGQSLVRTGAETGAQGGEGFIPDVLRSVGEMAPMLAAGPGGIPAMAAEAAIQRLGGGGTPTEALTSAGTTALGLGLGGKAAGLLGKIGLSKLPLGDYLSKVLGYTVGPQAVNEVEEGIRSGKLPDIRGLGERAAKNALIAAGLPLVMPHGKALEAASERPQAQPEPPRATVAPPEATPEATQSHADILADRSLNSSAANSLTEARKIKFMAEHGGREPRPDEVANFTHDDTAAALQIQKDALAKSIADPNVKRIIFVAGEPGAAKSTYIDAQSAEEHKDTVYVETHLEDTPWIKRAMSQAQAAKGTGNVEFVGVDREGGPVASFEKLVERADKTGKIVTPERANDLTRAYHGNVADVVNHATAEGIPVRGFRVEADKPVATPGVMRRNLPDNLEEQFRDRARESKYAEQFLTQGRPGGGTAQGVVEPPVRANGAESAQVPPIVGEGQEEIPQAPGQGTGGASEGQGGVRERALPQTLEDAGLPGGTNRTYDPISNPESLAKAQQNIREKGVDGVAESVRRASEPSAQTTADGLATIKAYSDAGQHQKAIDMASDLSEQLTKHGQAVQAVQVLNQLAPERVLMAAKKIADRNGVKFTGEDGARITDLAKQVQAKDAALGEARRVISDLVNAINVEAPDRTRAKVPVKVKMADWRTSLKQGADEAFEELKRLGVVERGSGFSTDQLKAAAKFGAYKLAEKGITLAEWTQHMVETFGEKIKEHLPQIRQDAYAIVQQARRDAALKQAETPEGNRTALQEVRQEIQEAQKAARAATREAAASAEGAAKIQAGLYERGLAEQRAKVADAEQQRVRDAQQLARDIQRTRTKTRQEAEARAKRWQTPIEDAAARSGGQTTKSVDDLTNMLAGKILKGTSPRQFEGEMSRHPEWAANRNKIVSEAYSRVQDAKDSVRAMQKIRRATNGEYGAMTPEQVQEAVWKRQTADRQARDARFSMVREFARLQGNDTWRDIDAVLKANMLASLGPYSHKVGSLAGLRVLTEAARPFQVAYDIPASLFTGKRTVLFDPAGAADAAKTTLTRGVREAGQILKRGYSDSGIESGKSAEEHATVQSKNPIVNAAKYVFQGYKAGAHIFGTFAYERAMNEQARLQAVNESRARAIKHSEIGQRTNEILVGKNVTDMARAGMEANALQAYAEATFQQENLANTAVQKFKRPLGEKTPKGWTFAANRVIPFMKSASNAVLTTLDYAGVGPKGALAETGKAAFGRSGQAELAKAWGKLPVGLSLMAIGGVLHRQGKMNSLIYHKDDNPNPGTIGIGNKLINIARYSPPGLLMAIGATIDELHQRAESKAEEEGTRAGVGSWGEAYLGAQARQIAEMPMLQNVTRFKESLESGKTVIGGVKDVGLNIARQAVPATAWDVYKGNEQAIRSAYPKVDTAAQFFGAKPVEDLKPDTGYLGKVLQFRNAEEPAYAPRHSPGRKKKLNAHYIPVAH